MQNLTIGQAGISYELICQRHLQCRLRDTRHVSGHIAHITVYEEAKGVLLYNVYLAHNSARAQLKVDSRLLESVLPDTCVTSGEREAVASVTAERLVAPITDRLVISPSRTTFATIGVGSRNRSPLFSRQGFALKIRSKVYNLNVTTQGRYLSRYECLLTPPQKLPLSAVQGGPGRRILRKVCLISGVRHLLTVWELGRNGLLRLTVYNPATSLTHEERLSKTERYYLGYTDVDSKSWIKDICRRLSLRGVSQSETTHAMNQEGRDEPNKAFYTVVLDKTVFSTACRVEAGRTESRILRMRASLLHSGSCLALDIYLVDSSKQCRILLKEDDLAEMGLAPCPILHPAEFKGGGPTGVGQALTKASRSLACAESKVVLAKNIARRLLFTPNPDSITFSINASSRTFGMNAQQWRPPKHFRDYTSSQASAKATFLLTNHAENFLRRRRQPTVLMYKNDQLSHRRPPGRGHQKETTATQIR